jgi:hypothetical protein
MNEQFERLMARVESLVTRIESVLPQRCRRPTGTARLRFVIASVRRATARSSRADIGAMRSMTCRKSATRRKKSAATRSSLFQADLPTTCCSPVTRNRQVIPIKACLEWSIQPVVCGSSKWTRPTDLPDIVEWCSVR